MPRSTGSALLETLIALLLLSSGLLALGRLQTRLWAGSDLAQQQGEALQLALADLEAQRHQGAINPAAWGSLSTQADTAVSISGSPSTYQQSRHVDSHAHLPLKALSPLLRWPDREGRWHRLSLHTLLSGHDRRLGAWLSLAPDAQGLAGPQGRHTAIPTDTRTLADGRLAFKPRADQAEVWLFERDTARIVGRCIAPVGLANNALAASDLSACTTLDARLLAGWIGFTGLATSLSAVDAEQPTGPVLPSGLQLTLSSTGHPSPASTCLSAHPDEPHPAGALPYWCLVQPAGTPAAWSGRLDLVPQGWTLAGPPDAGPEARRVCRYSADYNGNGLIDNPEHPASYSSVQGPLPLQNFLVIAAGATCPLDGPPQHSLSGPYNAVDDSTAPHQP